jgi:cytochrome b pre-mRNA-processing protein 3
MGNGLFSRPRAQQDGERLLQTVIEVSRSPVFFGEARVPDTLEGRFELMTLNAVLALIRLRGAPGVEPLAQAFTDQLFRHFDAGLREAGIGDLTVPKRMRQLAGSFYARLSAYSGAIDRQDQLGLEPALSLHILGSHGAHFAAPLARYVTDIAVWHASISVAALLTPVGWPARPG